MRATHFTHSPLVYLKANAELNWFREPGTNWFAKTCDFKMCREARDYYLTNDELSLDNNASLW